jgi:hypothetical protein
MGTPGETEMLFREPLWMTALLAITACAQELRVTWNELERWSGDQHRCRIVTRDGAGIEGRIERVEPEQLIVRVVKSSDSARRTEERATIERAAILKLAVRRESSKMRTKGALIGALVFGNLIGNPAAFLAGGGAKGTALAYFSSLAFFGAMGYFWGRSIDNKWTDVVLVDAAPRGAADAHLSPDHRAGKPVEIGLPGGEGAAPGP